MRRNVKLIIFTLPERKNIEATKIGNTYTIRRFCACTPPVIAEAMPTLPVTGFCLVFLFLFFISVLFSTPRTLSWPYESNWHSGLVSKTTIIGRQCSGVATICEVCYQRALADRWLEAPAQFWVSQFGLISIYAYCPVLSCSRKAPIEYNTNIQISIQNWGFTYEIISILFHYTRHFARMCYVRISSWKLKHVNENRQISHWRRWLRSHLDDTGSPKQ